MSIDYTKFARELVAELVKYHGYERYAEDPARLRVKRAETGDATLDLTPFAVNAKPVSAHEYFKDVISLNGLLEVYRSLCQKYRFEQNIESLSQNVSAYAARFMAANFNKAREHISDHQATLVAQWVKDLDVYSAVKSVESLLNSKADLRLLELAPARNWTVHFDHMAIRAGTRKREDALAVVDLLKSEHGYQSSQLAHEAFYQFSDGWSAYPMYKMLENGQALRIFVDQSDSEFPAQIIQHWNRVYGFTAHHLAFRVTRVKDGQRQAVPLTEVMSALEKSGIDIMQPTGMYTQGLLEQVFTKPERDRHVPENLKQEIAGVDPALVRTVENAKLLELVSRREMPGDFAREYFRLYGVEYNLDNHLHSAPVYQYFLPAQAQHVISTSVAS